jgi:hypothetical protein
VSARAWTTPSRARSCGQAFDRGTYKGCDLRGNDLSSIHGVGALKKVVIDRVQLLQPAEALADDLDVTHGDADDDRP